MDSLNQTTLKNLFGALDKVYTKHNLLITTKNLSGLLNFLTPFSVIKQKGKFEQLLWLDELPSQADFDVSAAKYESILVMISNLHRIEPLKQLWQLLGRKRKISLIVKDLSRSFFYQLNRELFNFQGSLLELSSEVDLDAVLRLAPNVRLIRWKANPILIEDFIISDTPRYVSEAREVYANSGLWQYLHNPLQNVSSTLESLMRLVESVENRKDLVKFRNIYAKGDHAGLFVNLLLEEKFPEYLDETFSEAEQNFFEESLSSNVDLVVLERNLDYFPLVMNPMTYGGLLDELNLFKTDGSRSSEFYNSTVFAGDQIFQNCKDLNFSSIGANLNKLARVLKSEVDAKDGLTDLNEIRKLVSNLGNLKLTQDLIRKHTSLSECVLGKIRFDLMSPYSHDFREKWLEQQNHIFDQDYKTQVRMLINFIDGNYPVEVILNFITLISLINDGIRAKDLDTIEHQMSLNYGVASSLTLASLLRCKIVKVNAKGNDFFGNFSFGAKFAESETTTTSTMQKSSASTTQSDSDSARYDDLMSLGITAGQDVYKSTYTLINKFWNLHPVEEDEKEASLSVETIKDYPNSSFVLPGGTVPLLFRMVESLYFRSFLKYKPTNNIYKRPNWTGLNMETMFKGKTLDFNLDRRQDSRKVNGSGDSSRQQYTIVVILGGITRAEISAFKYLNQKLDKKLYVLAPDIINNEDFYDSLKT